MPISAPAHKLKRTAKLLSRKEKIPYTRPSTALLNLKGLALGVCYWLKTHPEMPASKLFAQLLPGEMLLVGGRPDRGRHCLASD